MDLISQLLPCYAVTTIDSREVKMPNVYWSQRDRGTGDRERVQDHHTQQRPAWYVQPFDPRVLIIYLTIFSRHSFPNLNIFI